MTPITCVACGSGTYCVKSNALLDKGGRMRETERWTGGCGEAEEKEREREEPWQQAVCDGCCAARSCKLWFYWKRKLYIHTNPLPLSLATSIVTDLKVLFSNLSTSLFHWFSIMFLWQKKQGFRFFRRFQTFFLLELQSLALPPV